MDSLHRYAARIDPATMGELGVAAGDVVQVTAANGNGILARLDPPSPAESDQATVSLDRFMRQALHIRLGDDVTVSAAVTAPVEEVTLAPAVDVSLVRNLPEHLQDTLAAGNTPLSEGAVVYSLFPRSTGGTTYRVVSMTGGPGPIADDTRVVLAAGHRHHGEAPRSEITFEDVGGMDRQIGLIRELVELPLRHPRIYHTLGINPPRGIILHGPPGSGKTHLIRAIANEVHARLFTINGPDIVGTSHGETEGNLRRMFGEASHHAPSIVFIDELDAIAPKRDETGSPSDTRMVTQLLALLDGLSRVDGVMVIGTTNRIDSLDAAMRRPGRFDREVFVGPPDTAGRHQVLKIHSREMPLSAAASEYLEQVAAVSHGMVGADLMEVCREAGLTALRRRAKATDAGPIELDADADGLLVEPADFDVAIGRIRPSALREAVVVVPDTRWSDIGGLHAVKQQLRELVEKPLSHPEAFARLHVRPPVGVLLYGPPGTGKTLLAQAVAHECQVNFIAVTGPEIFSKWLGESEGAIRQLFRTARQVAPAVVFIDQLDAIAYARAGDASSRTADRVVSQLLTEMDGMEPLTGITVIGATNHIDRLDPAMLRSGRFGVHLEVPLPDEHARAEILAELLAAVPTSVPADLSERLAADTEGFSGAELSALCRNAALVALRASGYGEIRELDKEHLLAALADLKATRDRFPAQH